MVVSVYHEGCSDGVPVEMKGVVSVYRGNEGGSVGVPWK